MISIIDSASIIGFEGRKIQVEVDIARGLPSFTLVGLIESSIKEARVRVQSAIINSNMPFPEGKIAVNLAPADVKKDGTAFDLAIAMGILTASSKVSSHVLRDLGLLAELSLGGDLRPVRGVLALVQCLKEQGYKNLVVAKQNAQEASLVKDINIFTPKNLNELLCAIANDKLDTIAYSSVLENYCEEDDLDMADVVGQSEAKRALLIAAAGNHNVLLVGGPGCGKSMMAKRLPSLLPPMSYEEALIVTKVHSLLGMTMSGKLITKRPFRSPHHSITKAGLIGGGSTSIRPGEISLACYGVLFLDELLEFSKNVLEVLRQPLEEGQVCIGRANQNVTYPADIALIAALNPCPCGHFGSNNQSCTCSIRQIEKYMQRLSGPLLDRIDLRVNVPPVDLTLFANAKKSESSKDLRELVLDVRNMQKDRFKDSSTTNGRMTRKQIKNLALMSESALNLLVKSANRLNFSARSYDKIIKVARTIADLESSEQIFENHVLEALQFRGTSLIS